MCPFNVLILFRLKIIGKKYQAKTQLFLYVDKINCEKTHKTLTLLSMIDKIKIV